MRWCYVLVLSSRTMECDLLRRDVAMSSGVMRIDVLLILVLVSVLCRNVASNVI